ncbi:MAG: anti-sigma factor [Thermoleophilaceae bacterium]
MTPDSFAHALEQLDPGSRALLDLSLHRGLDDGEIAELLGSDPEYVSSSREAAIAQLAADLGMHGDFARVREALADMPEDAWRRESRRETVDRGQDAEPEPEPPLRHVAPLAPVSHERRQRVRPVFLLLALVAAVVAVVIATSGGGSKSTTAPNQASPAPKAARAPQQSAGVALASLSSATPGKATASLAGRKLTLTFSGLPKPAGSYEAWLYNDQIDAVPVASTRSGSATITAKLPRSYKQYRYLDVSLEPADGNPNHSGQSVLRVNISRLR